MKTKYYIAYGSNMDERQMAFRCPHARLVGKSVVDGYELLFKGSLTGSYATIEPNKNEFVPVLIWEITNADEKSLDIYEGYPTFYYKKNIKVTVEDKELAAMVYIMDEKRKLGIPSDRYFNVLKRAYQKFGFDYKILKKAYENSKEVTNENDKA